jgi:hypothetical protein
VTTRSKVVPKTGSGAVPQQPHQPNTQPDFGAAFHTDSQAPIHYERRWQAGNHRHDIIYISSYIHDATFRLDEIRWRGKSLTIPLNRARWELYGGVGDLVFIRSELIISPVISFRLELANRYMLRNKFLQSPELTVSRLQDVSGQWEDSDDEEIVINCILGSKLRLRVSDDLTFRVRLIDLSA